MVDLTIEDRALFEKLGEETVRAEVARGGDHAFEGQSDKRKAASEWLAERELQRSSERASPPKLTIIGPILFIVLVISLFIFVAAL